MSLNKQLESEKRMSENIKQCHKYMQLLISDNMNAPLDTFIKQEMTTCNIITVPLENHSKFEVIQWNRKIPIGVDYRLNEIEFEYRNEGYLLVFMNLNKIKTAQPDIFEIQKIYDLFKIIIIFIKNQKKATLLTETQQHSLDLLLLRNSTVSFHFANSDSEAAVLTWQITKSIAEAPAKKKLEEIRTCSDFYIQRSCNDNLPAMSSNLANAYYKMLQQIPGVSDDMAACVISAYPTMKSLIEAITLAGSRTDAVRTLGNIQIRRMAGIFESKRRLGEDIAVKIYALFFEEGLIKWN